MRRLPVASMTAASPEDVGADPLVGLSRGMRPYLRQVAGLLVIGSLCGIVMNTAIVLPAVLLGHAIDVVLAFRDGRVDGNAVGWAAVLLIGGTLATELPRVGKRWWLGVSRNRIKANVRADALRGVLSWPAERLHRTSVGDVMARVIGDVEVLGTGVGEVIVETWDTLLFSVSLVVAMLVYDPALGLLAVAPVPVALVLAKVVGVWVSQRTRGARRANAALTSSLQEGLTGLRVLRASGRGDAYTTRVTQLANEQADAELAAARLAALLAPVYTLLTTAGVVAVLWLGGRRVVAGAMTVGDLVAFLALFARFTGRAFRIPQMANRVQAAAVAYSRIAPLLVAAPTLGGEPRHASWRTDRIADPQPVPGARAGLPHAAPFPVELDGVTFTYPGAVIPALVGVSLDLPAGALVAITGPVGAGKSALARLVLGLFEPDRGTVRIDDRDPYGWSAADRANVGYLPQGHPVFSGTVAENVLLTETPATEGSGTEHRLASALDVAALADEVAAMPAAMATTIGELGVRVSGGQRQRIALARAMAAPEHRPRILVLDDPFSAVDVHTEVAIIAGLRDAVGPAASPAHRCTVLVCSTRLAAFPHADLVVVLDRGRAVEQGTHTELMAARGLYARIFAAQQHSRPQDGPG